jgi:hypothetical protein
MPIERFFLSVLFSKSLHRSCHAVWLAIPAVSIGFLDTFDLFDSSRASLPENFLQLSLLSFMSVLVCDLRLQKSAIA